MHQGKKLVKGWVHIFNPQYTIYIICTILLISFLQCHNLSYYLLFQQYASLFYTIYIYSCLNVSLAGRGTNRRRRCSGTKYPPRSFPLRGGFQRNSLRRQAWNIWETQTSPRLGWWVQTWSDTMELIIWMHHLYSTNSGFEISLTLQRSSFHHWEETSNIVFIPRHTEGNKVCSEMSPDQHAPDFEFW